MMTHSRINSWWNLSLLKTDFGRNKDHGEEIEMMIILPAKCIITHNTYTPGSCTALATAVPAALWTRCLTVCISVQVTFHHPLSPHPYYDVVH